MPSRRSQATGRRWWSVRSTPYPAGHEYEVPAASAVDAGCAPGAPTSSEIGNTGAVACEMDGGTL